MKNVISWLVVAVVGLGLMLFSHFAYEHETGPEEWQYTFMYVGRGEPNNVEAEGLEYIKRPARLLALSGRTKNFRQMAKGFGPDVERSYRIAFQEKVILYSDLTADFSKEMLEWGQLPASGADEVLAGYTTSNKDEIGVDGRALKVVGRLKKGISVFANSYLIGGGTAEELFEPDDEAVQDAYILRLPREQLSDSELREQLKKAFPKSQFTVYTPLIRTQPVAFLIYMGGLVLLLVGGCLALFKLYCILADRIQNKWLRLPLMEIRKYRRLFVAMNLVYFGTVVLFMLIVYAVPEFQFCLLASVKSQVTSGSGPLAIAGKAYLSKNIPLAALVTLGINFPLGSLLCLTLPSIIIPGSGVLVAGLRALLWGLLLSPSFSGLSGPM